MFIDDTDSPCFGCEYADECDSVDETCYGCKDYPTCELAHGTVFFLCKKGEPLQCDNGYEPESYCDYEDDDDESDDYDYDYEEATSND